MEMLHPSRDAGGGRKERASRKSTFSSRDLAETTLRRGGRSGLAPLKSSSGVSGAIESDRKIA